MMSCPTSLTNSIEGRKREELKAADWAWLWSRQWWNGKWQETHLQRLQFELLDVLVMNAGQIVPATTLEDRVWGKPVSDGALAGSIHKLRKKGE
jgi:DNA-binding response OmpR family regulator